MPALAFLSVLALVSQQRPAEVQAAYDEACPPERYEQASARLEAIRAADQEERKDGRLGPDSIPRDTERRREVAELFAEGCIKSGRDNHNAAQVFQHGSVPDHYYQTYIWAARAVQLGDEEARRLIPRGIDRYLLSSGYRQLFGTNATGQMQTNAAGKPTGEMVWCLPPVAEDFTDEARIAMGEEPLAEKLAWVAEMNSSGEGAFCDDDLADPPHGLFPGIW